MKTFMREFKAFALRGNVVDMAVGILIGGAFSGIVTALTANFINPILNVVTGSATYGLADVAGFASAFLSAVLNFLLIALVLFCILKAVNKVASLGKRGQAPEAPREKTCPYCREKIAIEATRCPHCTSVLEEQPQEAVL
ncbi:large conductance mechanosensitive channel protein MscL [bacterium 210820-DFI.6.52]|nr:large conductance mechanosensitive channel protein MscL [bacterium 210820-DFI.6.52]